MKVSLQPELAGLKSRKIVKFFMIASFMSRQMILRIDKRMTVTTSGPNDLSQIPSAQ